MAGQFIYSGQSWNVTAGLSHLTDDGIADSTFLMPGSLQQTISSRVELSYSSAYLYSQFKASDRVTLIFGGSADALEGRNFDNDQFSPKLGLIWQSSPHTTVRAALFRTLQRPFFSRQTVQPNLEPTEVAGFNQYLFASEGETTSQLSFALDHRLSDNVYIGGQIYERESTIPFLEFIPPSLEAIESRVDAEERFGNLYLAWLPIDSMSLSAKYKYESVDNSGQSFAEGFAKLRTRKLPLEINFFQGPYFSAGLTASYIRQDGEFPEDLEQPMGPTISDGDNFWMFDGSLRFRFPGRRGVFSLQINNLLDETIRFQDTDPENPRIFPERFVSTRFTLNF
jgi:outer membrane receptor protein involved in Fe transport